MNDSRLAPDEDVDYGVAPEDVPDTTRGPAFLAASVVIAAVLLCIMAVCGVGNCAFIAGLVRHRKLRSLTNLLMANLALSDVLVAALCCPLLLDYYVLKRLSWDHGLLMCGAVNYLRTLSLHVSTNALLAIAVDRYLAIVHPLRPRMKRQTAYCVMAAVWALPILIAIPSAVMSSETPYPSLGVGASKTFCAQIWPAERQAWYRSYFLLVLAVEFLGPVGVMAVCYVRISAELWFKDLPGFQTQQIRKRLRKRRRTVVVLILVLVAYVLCWTPYYSFALLRDFYPSLISGDRNSLLVFYVIECVAMSNGVINTLCFVGVRRRAQRPRGPPRFPLVPFLARKSTDLAEARTSSLRVTEDAGGVHSV
ncbi:prokineticin receptor 1a [Nerophis ophidion]|uniref:prokineticin receptor 1a n=1 Tax=Nerophis ophidion TaxID=159077 RepID=UPI002ADFCD6A|nr:prokineticin receptor 1a [Nerophis ophidion]